MTSMRLSIVPAFLALALAGCGSSAPSITTASVLGPEGASQAQPAIEVPATPEQRASQVASTSARAQKCGYNFDPVRLRTNFLAAEAQAGTQADQLAKAEKTYDIINSAMSKAVAGDADYCNDGKTKQIKADLTRHLAGDFSVPSTKKIVKQDKGFLASIFETQCESCDKKITADTYYDRSGSVKPSREW